MIKFVNLTKDYGKFRAVDNINLHIKPGELFGFLGPNGAGKTTTIKMMGGLLKPTFGRIIIKGMDIEKDSTEIKRIMGFIPDRPFIYDKLTGYEFLRFIGNLYGIKNSDLRIFKLLDLFELMDWKDELIEGYSHGMKQRLVVASVLLHNPEIIVVDEPMIGLDPKGARLVKEIFKSFCRSGKTVFMSTHSLEVVEEICDRMAIIQDGRIIAEGNIDDLRRLAKSKDKELESIFLKLTGSENIKEIINDPYIKG